MVACRGLSVGLTGNASTNAMVARAARSVLAAARQYAVMAAAAAEAAGDEDKEQQVGEAASLGRVRVWRYVAGRDLGEILEYNRVG